MFNLVMGSDLPHQLVFGIKRALDHAMAVYRTCTDVPPHHAEHLVACNKLYAYITYVIMLLMLSKLLPSVKVIQ